MYVVGTFQMCPICYYHEIAGLIQPKLSMFSTYNHWFQAPLPPVGVEDLDDDNDVVDTRCNPDDHLNSQVFTAFNRSAGIFRWIIGFVFFLLVLMVDSDKEAIPQHMLRRALYTHKF